MGVKHFGGVALWPFPLLVALTCRCCILHLLGPCGLWKMSLKIFRFLLPVSTYTHLNVANLTPSSGRVFQMQLISKINFADITEYYTSRENHTHLPAINSASVLQSCRKLECHFSRKYSKSQRFPVNSKVFRAAWRTFAAS